jgi:cytochrome P450
MYLDPGLNSDPQARFAQMAAEFPDVFWTPRNKGHWVLASHAAAFEALRDWETFSSAIPESQSRTMAGALPPGISRNPIPTPILFDPPAHGHLRQPLQATFSPRAAIELKVRIRVLADQLIDAVLAEGRCDFVAAIAEPLPVTVFLELMGLPVEQLGEFREIVHKYLGPRDLNDPFEFVYRNRMVVDSVMESILARRDDRRNDILSTLWGCSVGGEPVTYELMEDYIVLLFIAGLDTVVNGLAYAVRHLAQDQALQALLREKPELILDATEESLRRYGFLFIQRRLGRDTEFMGHAMRAGDEVVVGMATANLDPRRFPDPLRFDLYREDKAHITFGAGPHRCLGSHLARVELQILIEQLLARLPPFRLDPDRQATFHTGNIIGVDSLPIVWDA